MTKNHIHIIRMGGTIEFKDPGYEAINQQMMKLDTSIENYLKNMVKPHFTYSIETVCEKDSREITTEDLEKLAKTIEDPPPRKYINNARYLYHEKYGAVFRQKSI